MKPNIILQKLVNVVEKKCIWCLPLLLKPGLQVKAIINSLISEIGKMKHCLLSVSLEKGWGRRQRKDSAQYLLGQGIFSSTKHCQWEGWVLYLMLIYIFTLLSLHWFLFSCTLQKITQRRCSQTHKVNQASSQSPRPSQNIINSRSWVVVIYSIKSEYFSSFLQFYHIWNRVIISWQT